MAKKAAANLLYIVDVTPDTRNAVPEYQLYHGWDELHDEIVGDPDRYEGTEVYVVDLDKTPTKTVAVGGVTLE